MESDRFCGSGVKIATEIKSTGPYLWLWYHVDDTSHSSGFKGVHHDFAAGNTKSKRGTDYIYRTMPVLRSGDNPSITTNNIITWYREHESKINPSKPVEFVIEIVTEKKKDGHNLSVSEANLLPYSQYSGAPLNVGYRLPHLSIQLEIDELTEFYLEQLQLKLMYLVFANLNDPTCSVNVVKMYGGFTLQEQGQSNSSVILRSYERWAGNVSDVKTPVMIPLEVTACYKPKLDPFVIPNGRGVVRIIWHPSYIRTKKEHDQVYMNKTSIDEVEDLEYVKQRGLPRIMILATPMG
ncbi:hypothetical protein Ciccas_011770 [Cichlidogyrus casuarinus]|uniref:Uncharacterized protein n=1 Tax=Cichlidogyrus casuarinus TaxID=1844966 RepID=A0ABD2PS08_9PLAT